MSLANKIQTRSIQLIVQPEHVDLYIIMCMHRLWFDFASDMPQTGTAACAEAMTSAYERFVDVSKRAAPSGGEGGPTAAPPGGEPGPTGGDTATRCDVTKDDVNGVIGKNRTARYWHSNGATRTQSMHIRRTLWNNH